MSLFSLSLKNVKNSLSNYVMYFISIVFSVFIFFTFKSIQYNNALLVLSNSKQAGINGASIVIAVFSFLFIYYSNAFFFNRRKQEIGTYNLLGMRKNNIARLFLYESFIISIGAIIIGVALGFLFSKLMTMLLMKLMGEFVIVKMNLSIKALIQTIIIFIVIFVIISIRNTLAIKRKKLIDLFKKESEIKIQKKKSIVLGILGITLIIIGYLFAISSIIEQEIMLAPLVLIIILPGTFLFFSSALSVILDIIKKNKIFYYRGRNLVAFSQLSYNIKSNSRILSTISILIATSITILGFNISYYYDINRNINTNYKYSYNIVADNDNVNKKINKVLEKYKNNINLDKIVDLIESQANYMSIEKNTNIPRYTNDNIEIMKESDFKQIDSSNEYRKLDSDKHIYYTNDYYRLRIYNPIDGNKVSINNKEFIVQKEIIEPVSNIQSTFNVVIVTDNMYEQLKENSKHRKLRFINLKNKDSLKLANKLETIVNDNIDFTYPFNFTSSEKSYSEFMQMGGLMLFIGIFLSTIFLLCTGSIILFKQLSSIYDYKDRYIILKKIGANNKDIEKILSKQLKVIFILPLIIGTMHSLISMTIMQKLIAKSIVVPIVITLILYLIGYYIYYLITMKYAKNMIVDYN